MYGAPSSPRHWNFKVTIWRCEHRACDCSRTMAEITAGQQRGRPFLKGQSGNFSGRPPGARHKATIAAEALFAGEAEGLTRKARIGAQRRYCSVAVMP
jgi:hypothetical protein